MLHRVVLVVLAMSACCPTECFSGVSFQLTQTELMMLREGVATITACIDETCTTETVDFSGGDDARSYAIYPPDLLIASVDVPDAVRGPVSLRIERDSVERFAGRWETSEVGAPRPRLGACVCAQRMIDAR